jgi:prophage maintenance system killer protein
VDDNVPTPERRSEGYRASGHKVYQNLADVTENPEVWIPFHFLPGLEGNTQSEKLICRKNSRLAKKMMQALSDDIYNDSTAFFRLGIALHVYADTWAHQEFSGIAADSNIVNDLRPVFPNAKYMKKDTLASDIESDVTKVLPLGHATAVHYPDMPYVDWCCTPLYPEGRRNWLEFLEAAQEIYKVLSQKSGAEVAAEMSTEQVVMLREAFREIQYDDFNDRTAEWMVRISNNEFSFVGFDKMDIVQYDEGLILGDTDFVGQFYQAIEDHFAWVQENLRDEGIDLTAIKN